MKKFIAWTNTWSASQIAVLIVVIIALSSAGLFATHCLNIATAKVQTLQAEKSAK